jgi:ubiquinone biosynthesis protein
MARTLDPRLDIWTTAEPVVREWIAQHLGPVGQFESAARDAAQLLARIPGLLQRALRVAEQIDLAADRAVSLTSEIAAWEREARSLHWGTIALLVIVAFLVWEAL